VVDYYVGKETKTMNDEDIRNAINTLRAALEYKLPKHPTAREVMSWELDSTESILLGVSHYEKHAAEDAEIRKKNFGDKQ
jgi:hypothetical protein